MIRLNKRLPAQKRTPPSLANFCRLRRTFTKIQPKAWEFDKQNSDAEKEEYKKLQRETLIEIVRVYNKDVAIVQNFDIGHAAPQICLPIGKQIKIDVVSKHINACF